MDMLLFFTSLPLIAYGVAGITFRAVQRWPFCRHAWVWIPILFMGVLVSLALLHLLITVWMFNGQCSGWMEQGSHECSLPEYLTQDLPVTLAFLAFPLMATTAMAVSMFNRNRQRTSRTHEQVV